MNKVLLTGGTGFIGRNTFKYLKNKNFEIVCLIHPEENIPKDSVVQWIKVDLFNKGKLQEIIKNTNISHLLHFAWYTTPGKYWNSLINLDWIKHSLELLEFFIQYGGIHATFAGSCAEYDWNYGYCVENITPLNPSTLYGRSKNLLRVSAEELCKSENIEFNWGRIFHTFGSFEHIQRLVSSVIISLIKKQKISVTDGLQIRDFLFNEDIGSAFVSLLESDVKGGVNVASGSPVSIKELLSKIAIKLDALDFIEFGALPKTKSDPDLLMANTRILNEKVGWKPTYTLDQAIDLTINWWKEQEISKI